MEPLKKLIVAPRVLKVTNPRRVMMMTVNSKYAMSLTLGMCLRETRQQREGSLLHHGAFRIAELKCNVADLYHYEQL